MQKVIFSMYIKFHLDKFKFPFFFSLLSYDFQDVLSTTSLKFRPIPPEQERKNALKKGAFLTKAVE